MSVVHRTVQKVGAIKIYTWLLQQHMPWINIYEMVT